MIYEHLAAGIVSYFEKNYKNYRGGRFKDIVICGKTEDIRSRLVEKIERKLFVEAYVRNEESPEKDEESLIINLDKDVWGYLNYSGRGALTS
jgi:hypothetical protein